MAVSHASKISPSILSIPFKSVASSPEEIVIYGIFKSSIVSFNTNPDCCHGPGKRRVLQILFRCLCNVVVALLSSFV